MLCRMKITSGREAQAEDVLDFRHAVGKYFTHLASG